jgi:hypothetical protein
MLSCAGAPASAEMFSAGFSCTQYVPPTDNFIYVLLTDNFISVPYSAVPSLAVFLLAKCGEKKKMGQGAKKMGQCAKK